MASGSRRVLERVADGHTAPTAPLRFSLPPSPGKRGAGKGGGWVGCSSSPPRRPDFFYIKIGWKKVGIFNPCFLRLYGRRGLSPPFPEEACSPVVDPLMVLGIWIPEMFWKYWPYRLRHPMSSHSSRTACDLDRAPPPPYHPDPHHASLRNTSFPPGPCPRAAARGTGPWRGSTAGRAGPGPPFGRSMQGGVGAFQRGWVEIYSARGQGVRRHTGAKCSVGLEGGAPGCPRERVPSPRIPHWLRPSFKGFRTVEPWRPFGPAPAWG